MKLRIRFTKTGEMKYIGHLDLLRFFQKVLRRAGTDVKFSEGFSPHMLLSFALPMPVGMESLGEILDLEVNSLRPGEKLCDELNACTVRGIEMKEAALMPDHAKNSMSLVTAADYLITKKNGKPEGMEEALKTHFFDRPEFTVIKKTKKKETAMNLKDYIFDIHAEENGLFLKLSSGSENNVKPSIFLEEFFSRCGEDFSPSSWNITRLALYQGNREKGFTSLLSEGKLLP